jgi:hypothetical protein
MISDLRMGMAFPMEGTLAVLDAWSGPSSLMMGLVTVLLLRWRLPSVASASAQSAAASTASNTQSIGNHRQGSSRGQ